MLHIYSLDMMNLVKLVKKMFFFVCDSVRSDLVRAKMKFICLTILKLYIILFCLERCTVYYFYITLLVRSYTGYRQITG
jgi:hypothetical protein